jgi:hypothetical protein
MYALRADEEAAKAPKPKCPVSGNPADMELSVDYSGAKVYLCCEGCPEAFQADLKKYAPLANHQLMVTRQFKQVKCPLSGGKLNPEAKVQVGDVEVQFCCMSCQGKVSKAEGEEQIALVFGETPFKKGFELIKDEDDAKKQEESN